METLLDQNEGVVTMGEWTELLNGNMGVELVRSLDGDGWEIRYTERAQEIGFDIEDESVFMNLIGAGSGKQKGE